MNRDFLSNLGLSEEQIEKIMSEHGKVVQQKNKELSEASTKIEEYEKQVANFDEQINKLKESSKDNETLSEQLKLIKEARETEKLQFKKALTKQQLDFAVENTLRDHNVRNVKVVKNVLNMKEIKFEDNKITGLEEQIQQLKETDGYLFAETQGLNGRSPQGGSKKTDNTYKGINPYKKETFNLTEQFKLEQSNPELAKKLEEQVKEI